MKIQDTDILLLNQGGTDYKITALELKEKINEKPWDNWDYGVFHIMNSTEEMSWMSPASSRDSICFDMDGNVLSEPIPANTEFVMAITVGCQDIFQFTSRTLDWDFGPLTDTSKVESMLSWFAYNEGFTGSPSMGDWDVSKVVAPNFDTGNFDDGFVRTFYECKSFNQDLSKWCVPKHTGLPGAFDANCVSWPNEFKPVWGTCPRGEDQS